MAIYGNTISFGGGGGSNDTLPPLLNNFSAAIDESQTGQVVLSADKIEERRAKDLAGAVWVYGDHIPQNKNDGTKIELTRTEIVGADGKVQKEITDWDKSKNFYARQFTYNSKKQYQTMLEGAIASPDIIPEGQEISKLPSGSKVKLGTWNDTPLQWKVARDTSNQAVRLVLEPVSMGVLGNKMYDNKEPSNGDANRRKHGNNRYIWSNIHQWLNSTKGTNWYMAQHGADAPPNYNGQAGFLNGWDAKHLSCLYHTNWVTTRTRVDSGGTESFTARVALLSTTELGLQSATGNGKLDIFNSNGDRATGGIYWTRTPFPSDPISAHQVNSDGTLGYFVSTINELGVRPLCTPLSSTLVSLELDSDGCYTVVA